MCGRPVFLLYVRNSEPLGVRNLFLGGCAIGVDFGFENIHVQTPVPGWRIEVVETVFDVDDVLTFDQDVLDVSVVASAGICPRGGHSGKKMVEEGVEIENEE